MVKQNNKIQNGKREFLYLKIESILMLAFLAVTMFVFITFENALATLWVSLSFYPIYFIVTYCKILDKNHPKHGHLKWVILACILFLFICILGIFDANINNCPKDSIFFWNSF